MQRVRWYSGIVAPATLDAFSDLMEAEAYGRARRKAGFRILKRRRRASEAEYIERRETSETIDSPLGSSETFLRIQYVITRFVLSADGPALEFIDPPRSVAEVVRRVADCMPNGGELTPIAITPHAWFEAIERATDNAVVNAVTVEGITLDHATAATARIEGSDDVRVAMDKWLGRRSRSICAIEFTVRGMRAEIFENGRSRILNGDVTEARTLLREALYTHSAQKERGAERGQR